jgi:ribosomal protein S7
MWKRDQFDALISEAIGCDRQLYRKKTKIEDNIVVGKIFNRLMLNGKVREATRFVTNRSNGGILNPNENIVDDMKTVFDVLENKHPNSIIPEIITYKAIFTFL